jgi:hypothetical protein
MIKIIKKKIIPEKLISNDKFFRIKLIDNKYITREFEIHLNNKTKKIEKLRITKGRHPNCDPKTKDFCMPEFLKEQQFNSESMDLIINMIKLFNFKSSYETPWNSFELI